MGAREDGHAARIWREKQEGLRAEELSEEVVVINAQAEAEMSYEVSGLDVGTWYFTIQVQDTNGLISEPSDVVSKSIRS